MLRGMYDKTLTLAEHPRALWALAFISFLESSVFPIPPDVMMIPMILAAPRRAWLIALVATLSSVAGAVLGYAIGAFFYESIGAPVLEALGKGDSMQAFNGKFNEYGVWAVLVAGLTPFPFKVITIMSGWTAMPLVPFILSSIVARAARFFIVAGLLYYFGPPIRDFIERRLGLVFTLFCVALVGGFMVLRLI